MTFQDANGGTPQSPDNPVPTDRLNGILRTGRFKSTGGRKERRDPPLIACNYPDTDSSHEKSMGEASNPSALRAAIQASRNCACRTVKASRRGKTNRSYPILQWSSVCLANSRKTRFARFLMTALPNRLPTMTPTRIRGSPDMHETRLNSGVETRRPFCLTRSMSALFRRKRGRRAGRPDMKSGMATRSAEPGPWPGAGPTPSDRPWCSCVFEIRDLFSV